MRLVLCLILVTGLSGSICERRPAPFEPNAHLFDLGDTLVVKVDETWTERRNTISIRFDSLAEDSRCPLLFRCVWQGNAKVVLTCTGGAGRATFGLNTYPDFLNDTTVFGRRIELLDVIPYPISDVSIPKEDYSVKMVVE